MTSIVIQLILKQLKEVTYTEWSVASVGVLIILAAYTL